jgi:NADP-dependent 3-hydroxy acid dehydrogenase YdfG
MAVWLTLPLFIYNNEVCMSDGIKNKVVIIVGASSGLGEATARRLAKEGAILVLGARRVDRLEKLAAELQLPPEAILKTDVVDPKQVQALADRAFSLYGRIDVMVNNAGVMPHSLLERTQINDWNDMIDINLKGVLHGIAAVLPYMKAQQSGHIINTSSVAGHKVRPGNAVYAATKTAVRVISEGLRQEVTPYNIRTTIISPGAVESELVSSITDATIAKNIKEFYDNVAISADSFARVVAFAISQPEDVDINEVLFRPTRQEL